MNLHSIYDNAKVVIDELGDIQPMSSMIYTLQLEVYLMERRKLLNL